ncbi:unnamed protein product [Camellia sinensis]
MPFLTGVRGDEKPRAPAAGERGRGAGVARIYGRRSSGARQRARWLELPTTLTYWRYSGKACQIPIEPAPAGHELVGVQGPTPVCTILFILHIYLISVMLYRTLILSTHLQASIEYTG